MHCIKNAQTFLHEIDFDTEVLAEAVPVPAETVTDIVYVAVAVCISAYEIACAPNTYRRLWSRLKQTLKVSVTVAESESALPDQPDVPAVLMIV